MVLRRDRWLGSLCACLIMVWGKCNLCVAPKLCKCSSTKVKHDNGFGESKPFGLWISHKSLTSKFKRTTSRSILRVKDPVCHFFFFFTPLDTGSIPQHYCMNPDVHSGKQKKNPVSKQRRLCTSLSQIHTAVLVLPCPCASDITEVL